MQCILIVDDDRHMGELTRLMVRSLDYDVIQVMDGSDILEVLAEVNPRLVLMDLFLPHDMNGWKVTEVIRTSPAYQNLPVVAFTAAGGVVNESTLLAAGFNGLLRKPFSSGELRDCIVRFLDAAV